MIYIIARATVGEQKCIRLFDSNTNKYMDATMQSVLKGAEKGLIENAKVTNGNIEVSGNLDRYGLVTGTTVYKESQVVIEEVRENVYRVVDVLGNVCDMRTDDILAQGIEQFPNVEYTGRINALAVSGTGYRDMKRPIKNNNSSAILELLTNMSNKNVKRTNKVVIYGVEFSLEPDGVHIDKRKQYDRVLFPRNAYHIAECKITANSVEIPEWYKTIDANAFFNSRIFRLTVRMNEITSQMFKGGYIKELVIGKEVKKVNPRAMLGAKVRKVVVESSHTDVSGLITLGDTKIEVKH